ncbi:MAG: type I-C CRISPR-associated endonuclease Cas1c [Pyrinomonadaceae bacterium]|nr:type I-C CRISPR-associated endonuclease Cas1c [Pyrinomonadaceae bacterium]MDW8305430.1 type I-C CRISPR-associated endonuclease Cas1c [Acidobacteriota bacterium]
MEIKQKTLFITTSGNYISRDHLTLRIEQDNQLKLAIPIHHIDSICNFGYNTFTPQALELCWENGIAVNCFSETGYFYGRWEGVPNTSVVLRRNQYRRADDEKFSVELAKAFVKGKIMNCRQSVMRTARNTSSEAEADKLRKCAKELGFILKRVEEAETLDAVRGFEGQAADLYFGCFSLHLSQQRQEFSFEKRTKRPPLDFINCLISFLYALICHDCIAALTAVGFDPFVGYLHADRPNRPSLALDLMEEFRPILADRLAITLINRLQIQPEDFFKHEGGAVELTQDGRKKIIAAYQTKKQETITHPILQQEIYYGQVFFIQARILARHVRGDTPKYYPFIPR